MRYQQLSLACLTLLSIASAANIPRQWQDYQQDQYDSTGGPTEAEDQDTVCFVDDSNTGGSNTGSSDAAAASQVSSAQPSSSTGGTTPSPIASNSSSTTGSATGASVSAKKGAGVWAVSGLGEMVTHMGATWAYDWSDHPEAAFTFNSSVPSGVDLVAMIKPETDISSLASSSYKEIIGYNEPDSTKPHVDVNTAINNWPAVVATGKRIGSPAPANTKLVQGDWFYDFMSGIEAKGSHVDFICLHHYATTGSVSDFQAYLESVYNMYKLPIWVTEWAYVDYSNPDGVGVTPGVSEQVSYMQAAAKMLEGLSYVERYAWFALPQSSVQPDTYLFDSNGNITPQGTAYTAL